MQPSHAIWVSASTSIQIHASAYIYTLNFVSLYENDDIIEEFDCPGPTT